MKICHYSVWKSIHSPEWEISSGCIHFGIYLGRTIKETLDFVVWMLNLEDIQWKDSGNSFQGTREERIIPIITCAHSILCLEEAKRKIRASYKIDITINESISVLEKK